MKGYLVCFVGVDGTGKTALAKKFVANMIKNKVPVKYVWFRFPYFFTLPLLLIARTLNLTKYTRKAGYRIVEHNFVSQPLRTLYPFVLFLDALLYYFYKVSVRTRAGFVVVCDRWVPDIIIDASIDTSNLKLEHNWIGKLYELLSLKTTLEVVVDASDTVLRKRRPEAEFDSTTKVRRFLYRSYAKRHQANIIYSDSPLEVTFRQSMLLVSNSNLIFRQNDKTYGSSNVWLRPLLKRRFFAIASNWFFQGTLIMTASERVFRFLLELSMFALLFAGMSFLVPLVLSVIIAALLAHTINWVLNGNFWVVYKFFGRQSNPELLTSFLAKLRSRKDFAQNGVLAVSAFGSLSRGEFKSSSDLDMRVVRRTGVGNWMKANLFALKLRSTSFFRKIPLDLFVLDSASQVYEHISRDEKPVVVYDAEGVLNVIAENCISLEEKFVEN